MCTTWFLPSSPPRGGDICDPELATRIAANEPSPEGRPAGLTPTDPKLSARKGACSTAIFYDRSQADLLILNGSTVIAAGLLSTRAAVPLSSRWIPSSQLEASRVVSLADARESKPWP